MLCIHFLFINVVIGTYSFYLVLQIVSASGLTVHADNLWRSFTTGPRTLLKKIKTFQSLDDWRLADYEQLMLEGKMLINTLNPFLCNRKTHYPFLIVLL